MPVALITPCLFFSYLMNGPAWGSLFAIYFAMGVAEEFGPGYTPAETESPLQIVARVVVVIGQGVVGMVVFVALFSANFWDLQKT